MELLEIDKLKEISLKCAKLLDEKKANNIMLLDVGGLTPLADFFLIASAPSFMQIKTLQRFIEDELVKDKIKRKNPRSPYNETPWLLSDYGFIVVHLFLDEARDYYNIEKFWHDADIIFEGQN